ncbi:imidazolonepropionase-like domain-containing protein [Streptomyces sp. NPDC052013]|uniref:imidazolonepropionase-like domain-containing protein n=1 Tax=Streptomyces sp. NPDC052013 TaxID=3365679 RepID=UPI0037D6D532
MLTIHTADTLRIHWDAEPLKNAAVAVEGDRVAAVGPLEELRDRFPGARVRTWPGTMGPGRLHDGPLPDAPSPRERIHAILKLGAVAVLERHVDSPGLRAAAERNDVRVLPTSRPAEITIAGRADLAVLDEAGACIATVCAGRLVHRRR